MNFGEGCVWAYYQTYWHSSAHVLGQALELEFGVDLTIGPAIEEGFYYDAYIGDSSLAETDKAKLKNRMEVAVKVRCFLL